MTILRFVWRVMRFGLRLAGYMIGLGLLLFLLQGSTFLTDSQWNRVAVMVSRHQFDYIGWELNALAVKVGQTLYGQHPFMTEAARSQYVRDYMGQLVEAQQLETQISAVFTDPGVDDPDAASAELRVRRDGLRELLRQKQPLMESILEGQTAAVLVEQGFGLAGQLLPPISMHFTEVPNLLVISPRDKIRLDISINLYPLTVDEKNAIEESIDHEEDVSSLIVPLGGMALYPAMILETTSIPFAVETFAHEWLHHYLFLFPLGFDYFTGGDAFASEARIINETTADLFGKEIGRLVLERYYPDLVPPLPTATSETSTPIKPTEPPPFDFGAAMHETRVTVDGLLADGKVEEAETYMEERRKLFFANGYVIRKLNQAFFAFYGGYQAGGVPGVGGEDPIGPAVRDIRSASASVYEWVAAVRGITTREQLLVVRDRLKPPDNPPIPENK